MPTLKTMINKNKASKLLAYFTICTLPLLPSCKTKHQQTINTFNRKREARGAWIPTIFRSEYIGLSKANGQKILREKIAYLKSINCNMVLFQIRAESDSWYRSSYEPWSKYFTGEQGKEPYEYWDPLAFVIDECHKNGMELHAWINPYRGASNSKSVLHDSHIYKQHPEWFITYNNQLVLDPGNPNSRRHILMVTKEIISNYDLDALHLDDYFYPYPANNIEFPDNNSFKLYGYNYTNKAEWRRNNINMLIYELHQQIKEIKPWVKLGISPFGIYRNKKTNPKGSNTNGLQNYDDLYADVVKWANEGWINYVAPQIYWNIGFHIADYQELVLWWKKAITNKETQLYIGQDIKRTQDSEQLPPKLKLSAENSDGNIYWPADELFKNYKSISTALKNQYQNQPALLPEWKGSLGKTKAPKRIKKAWISRSTFGTPVIHWITSDTRSPEDGRFYAVYIYPEGVKAKISDINKPVSISNSNSYDLKSLRAGKYTILITPINRFWQEGRPYKLRIEI